MGNFFTQYASATDWFLAPAWLEGREIIAVFPSATDPDASYLMQLTWRDGKIVLIRDFRYARYIAQSAEIILTGEVGPLARIESWERQDILPVLR